MENEFSAMTSEELLEIQQAAGVQCGRTLNETVWEELYEVVYQVDEELERRWAFEHVLN